MKFKTKMDIDTMCPFYICELPVDHIIDCAYKNILEIPLMIFNSDEAMVEYKHKYCKCRNYTNCYKYIELMKEV